MILEVAMFGLIGVWLLALLPAAVVTLLKHQWLYFLCGWLTLGIVWLIGAASPAPADSPWARWFYGREKLARLQEPDRRPRSRRGAAYVLAGTAALALVLGAFAARPSPIVGIGGGPLENSVGGANVLPGLELPPCRHLVDDRWMCSRWDDQGSSQVSYLVSVDSLGCWRATRSGSPGGGHRWRRSGCVTILDYVLG